MSSTGTEGWMIRSRSQHLRIKECYVLLALTSIADLTAGGWTKPRERVPKMGANFWMG